MLTLFTLYFVVDPATFRAEINQRTVLARVVHSIVIRASYTAVVKHASAV